MADANAPDLTGDNRKIWEANPPTFVDRRVGMAVRFLWWLRDFMSPRKEYMVAKVTRNE